MTQTFRAGRDVIVRTEDSDGAQAFYEGVLGFRRVSESPTMCGYEAGAFRLYVEKGPAHGPVFDFLVRDVAAAKAAALAAGCVLLEEDPAVPRCYVRDPYGVAFNIGLAE
jgi:catechol 2,3-dioxygenase-like lactoylglutathione lyase family enzyme